MKYFTQIKKTAIHAVIITLLISVVSCVSTQNSDQPNVYDQENRDRIEKNKRDNDAKFLVNAAQENLTHIQSAQLAQQNGQSEQVRELGKMMEENHTKAQKELKALALAKNIQIPSTLNADSQESYNRLYNQESNNFDKAYSDMMVTGHQNSIEAFEKASIDSYDTDIKNWATSSLAGLRKDLDSSLESQKKSNSVMYFEKNQQ